MSTPVRYGEHERPKLGTACTICSLVLPKLRVDHCHRHDWVRGAVCPSCNASMAWIDRRVAPKLAIETGTVTLDQLIKHANTCPDCPTLTVSDLGHQPQSVPTKPAIMWRPAVSLHEELRWAAYSLRKPMTSLITKAVEEWIAANRSEIGERPADLLK